MKNNVPTAISTLNLEITMTQPPSCPNKLIKTNIVARNLPQPQLMSMYSRCSFHWNHIRSPSSKKVAIKQRRATIGRMFLPFLIICKIYFRRLFFSLFLRKCFGKRFFATKLLVGDIFFFLLNSYPHFFYNN